MLWYKHTILCTCPHNGITQCHVRSACMDKNDRDKFLLQYLLFVTRIDTIKTSTDCQYEQTYNTMDHAWNCLNYLILLVITLTNNRGEKNSLDCFVLKTRATFIMNKEHDKSLTCSSYTETCIIITILRLQWSYML